MIATVHKNSGTEPHGPQNADVPDGTNGLDEAGQTPTPPAVQAETPLPQLDIWLYGLAIVAGVAGVVVLLCTVYIVLAKYRSALSDPAVFDAGLNSNIGEFVGGVVGTLFAFVAVLLYFTAIRMQSRELRMMRGALALQEYSVKVQVIELRVLTQEISRGEKTRNHGHCLRDLREAQSIIEAMKLGAAIGVHTWFVLFERLNNLVLLDLGASGGINGVGYFCGKDSRHFARMQTGLERMARFAHEVQVRNMLPRDKESLLVTFHDLLDGADLRPLLRTVETIRMHFEGEVLPRAAAEAGLSQELGDATREIMAIEKYLRAVSSFVDAILSDQ